ncbi:DUF3887 domain-containing protein [candidate division KSB1 bacterium]
MKRIFFLLMVLILVLSVISCAQEKKSINAPELEELAKEFVELLVAEDFNEAAKMFDDKMREALPVEKLQKTWEGLISQMGSFQKELSAEAEEVKGNKLVVVKCQFEKSAIDIRVVFNKAKKVSGLWFAPAK